MLSHNGYYHYMFFSFFCINKYLPYLLCIFQLAVASKSALAENNVINAQAHIFLPKLSHRDIFSACCDLLKACFNKGPVREGNRQDKNILHTKNLVLHNTLKSQPSVQSSWFSELSLALRKFSYTPLSTDDAAPSVLTTSRCPKLLLQALSSLPH